MLQRDPKWFVGVLVVLFLGMVIWTHLTTGQFGSSPLV